MEAIYVLFFLLILAAFLYKPKVSPPEAGNPKLPTVSQSRKIPFGVGKFIVDGPNVLDASEYLTNAIKQGGGGLFGSSQVTGYQFYQTIEMAIAFGPLELYEIRFGNYSGWAGNLTTQATILIEKQSLFGDRKAEGGVYGNAEFIPGDSAGFISNTMESITGRDQPGYPNLARVIFTNGTSGFLWGNSHTYKPASFVCGHYPDPLSNGDHKIGDLANPAYILHELAKNNTWGLESTAPLDLDALTSMGATLYSEGLGIARVWYSATALEIEREILALVDGVRFRDTDGKIVYKLIRDPGDLGGVPHLTDAHIVFFEIQANSLSNVASRVTTEYVDIGANFKTIKLSTVNAAVRQSIGRPITVSQSHPGAGTATNAQKINSRESLKHTRSRRRGVLHASRAAWRYAPGDTILVSYSPVGSSSLPIRVIEHEKGTDVNGLIKIKWIEETFDYGRAVFTTPNVQHVNYVTDPVAVVDKLIVEVPYFLLNGSTASMISVCAVDPSTSIDCHLYSLSGSAEFIEEFPFSQLRTIAANSNLLDISISINGFVDVSEYPPVSDATIELDRSGKNLVYIDTADGIAIIWFTDVSYDINTGISTLTGVNHGIMHSLPKKFSVGDRVWFANEFSSPPNIFGFTGSTEAFELRPRTSNGVLDSVSAPNIVVGYQGSETKPLPAGNVNIDSVLYREAASGTVSLFWVHRDILEPMIRSFTDGAGPTRPTNVTYTVEFWNYETTTLRQSTTLITGITDSYLDTEKNYLMQIIIKTIDSVDGKAIEDYEHIFEYNADTGGALTHTYLGSSVVGSVLTDDTGSDDGTLVNITLDTWGTDESLVFNGTSSEITFLVELFAELDFSVSFWMKHPTAIAAEETIFSINGPTDVAADNSNTLRIGADGDFEYFTETGAGVDHVHDLAIAAEVDSVFHHYVMVVETAKMSFYKDNVKVVHDLAITNVDAQTLTCRFGKYNKSGSESWLDAELGRIKIYNNAITRTQVTALFDEV